MNLYNNKLTRRTNKFIRNLFITPILKKRLKKDDWTLICNNCLGGLVTHDFNQQFRSPTVNLFFPSLSFFDFVEHLDYYLQQTLINGEKDDVNYPIGILKGKDDKPDIEIHFMHYDTFTNAREIWNKRKSRMNLNNIFVVWTFAFGNYKEADYKRFQALPILNKIAFVNKPELCEKYSDMYYIKGFEKENSLGNILLYSNLFGKKYYDQFDFAKWFNR